MTDRRLYTGTQALQLAWSLLALAVVVLTQAVLSGPGVVPAPLVFVSCTVVWFVGLVAFGLWDRREWNEMVATSSFQPRRGSGTADLERIVQGYTVSVTTSVPGVFSQTHTTVRTSVDGVDASFTVTISHDSVADGDGLRTGNERLDDRYAIRGSEQNVARILSPDVRRALLELDLPGRCTVTGEAVSYEIPFTRLTPTELETTAVVVVMLARRVETVAGGGTTPDQAAGRNDD